MIVTTTTDKCAEHSQHSSSVQWQDTNEVIQSNFLISPGDIYPNCMVELKDANIKETTLLAFESNCEEQHEVLTKNNKDIGHTQLIKMEFDTQENLPAVQSPYMLNVKHYNWVTKTVTGIIEQSLSPWASPVIIVLEKSAPVEPQRRCLCVDCHKVNALQKGVKRTERSTSCLSLYPLPKIVDMFSTPQFSQLLTFIPVITIAA